MVYFCDTYPLKVLFSYLPKIYYSSVGIPRRILFNLNPFIFSFLVFFFFAGGLSIESFDFIQARQVNVLLCVRTVVWRGCRSNDTLDAAARRLWAEIWVKSVFCLLANSCAFVPVFWEGVILLLGKLVQLGWEDGVTQTVMLKAGGESSWEGGKVLIFYLSKTFPSNQFDTCRSLKL